MGTSLISFFQIRPLQIQNRTWVPFDSKFYSQGNQYLHYRLITLLNDNNLQFNKESQQTKVSKRFQINYLREFFEFSST